MNTYESAEEFLKAVNLRTPLQVKISCIICQVFYRHFFHDDGGKQMLEAVDGLPGQIEKEWATEYDLFGERLLRGEFIIPDVDPYVRNYLLHYTTGVEIESLEDSRDFFDFGSSPTKTELNELRTLIEATNKICVNHDSLGSIVAYVGGKTHMKYIGE